jgi:hypothetical protein
MKNPPTDTPIPTDVVEEEETKDVVLEPEVKTARETTMDAIIARRSEEIESDISEDVPEDVDLSEEIVEDEVIVVEKEEVPEKITVKIDGADEEITPEQIREYQKNRSADIRMREAAESKKQLDEREADIVKRESALVEPPEAKVVPAETAEALAKRLVKSTFDEDEVEAAKVIQEIMGSQQQPAAQVATPQADIDAAVDNVLFRREQKKAITKFETEYSFLATNMRDSVNERSKVERENDPNASTWIIIKRSAEHVQSEIAKEFGTKEPEKKKEIIPDLEARRQLKKDTGNTVKTNTTVKSTLPDPAATKPATRQQIFSEIQQSRGQG